MGLIPSIGNKNGKGKENDLISIIVGLTKILKERLSGRKCPFVEAHLLTERPAFSQLYLDSNSSTERGSDLVRTQN